MHPDASIILTFSKKLPSKVENHVLERILERLQCGSHVKRHLHTIYITNFWITGEVKEAITLIKKFEKHKCFNYLVVFKFYIKLPILTLLKYVSLDTCIKILIPRIRWQNLGRKGPLTILSPHCLNHTDLERSADSWSQSHQIPLELGLQSKAFGAQSHVVFTQPEDWEQSS